MKQLGQSAVGTGAGTTLYTVPTGFQTNMMDIVITNTTSSSISFSIHIVPSGDSASTSNSIFYQVPLSGNTTVQWTGTQHMSAGKFIKAIGSASGITMTISGEESRA